MREPREEAGHGNQDLQARADCDCCGRSKRIANGEPKRKACDEAGIGVQTYGELVTGKACSND
jgi:hypothetical protein